MFDFFGDYSPVNKPVRLRTVQKYMKQHQIVTTRRNGLNQEDQGAAILKMTEEDPLGRWGGRLVKEKLAHEGIHIPRSVFSLLSAICYCKIDLLYSTILVTLSRNFKLLTTPKHQLRAIQQLAKSTSTDCIHPGQMKNGVSMVTRRYYVLWESLFRGSSTSMLALSSIF